MMKLVLTLGLSALVLFTTPSFAKVLTGEGRFYSQKEDSQSFVKQQLLYLAFRDVISQEMEGMGLDSSLFWKKYEEKFERFFLPVEEELKKKYKIYQEGEEVSSKQKIEYGEKVRKKRLGLKRKYGRLQRVINKFSIEKISRSTKMANARYIRVKASINKKRLHEIFLKFTSSGVGRTFRNLYLSFDFNLDNATWKDVGVESEQDFTSVVRDYWKKWFEENAKTYVENVSLIDQVKAKEIESYLTENTSESLIPTPEKKETTSETEGEGEEQASAPLHEGPIGVDEFGNSLWLRLSMTIKKLKEDEIVHQREFSFRGDYVLVELGTNRLIDHMDFPIEKRSYIYEDFQKISSSIASFVYSVPLKSFSLLKNKMAGLRGNSQKLEINVKSANSLFDLIQVRDLLAEKGMRYQFDPNIQSFDFKGSVLNLSFQGDRSKVDEVLRELNGVTVGDDKILNVNSSGPLSLELKTSTKVKMDHGNEQTQKKSYSRKNSKRGQS